MPISESFGPSFPKVLWFTTGDYPVDPREAERHRFVPARRQKYRDRGIARWARPWDLHAEGFFTRRSAVQLLDAAGLEEQRRAYNPGLLRPFVPLAKKLLTRRRGDGPVDPDALLGSRPYKLYVKTAYPIESAVARLWPGALAFQMIFEARPRR